MGNSIYKISEFKQFSFDSNMKENYAGILAGIITDGFTPKNSNNKMGGKK